MESHNSRFPSVAGGACAAARRVRTGVNHPSVKLPVYMYLAQNDRENDWKMQGRRQFCQVFRQIREIEPYHTSFSITAGSSLVLFQDS